MEPYRPALVCAGPHVPVAVGTRAGIRCLHCNAPVEPDPRVTATAERPWSPNTEATAAAVNARGSRCDRCGHWTYRRPFTEPKQGRPSAVELCGNCISTGDGETAVVRIRSRHQGDVYAELSVSPPEDQDAYLASTAQSGLLLRTFPKSGIRRDPSVDAQAAAREDGS